VPIDLFSQVGLDSEAIEFLFHRREALDVTN
jgi:hypothetical protein